jgi:hypothetical protein
MKKEICSGITYSPISKYRGVFIAIFLEAVLTRLFMPDDMR